MIDVNWIDLELAFRDATDAQNYLDNKTGEIITLHENEQEYELENTEFISTREEILREPKRFLRIHAIQTSFSKEVMRAFIEKLQSTESKQSLLKEFEGKGGYSRTLRKLKQEKVEIINYYRYEQHALWNTIEDFLKDKQIKYKSQPPTLQLFGD